MVKVITNNAPRNLVYGYELTAKERAEFDYIKSDEIDTHDFFRYRGNVYDPHEFMCAPDDMKPWQGYQGDSYFSGIVIRYTEDNESIIVGTYIS
jgi:hypothetical protein